MLVQELRVLVCVLVLSTKCVQLILALSSGGFGGARCRGGRVCDSYAFEESIGATGL